MFGSATGLKKFLNLSLEQFPVVHIVQLFLCLDISNDYVPRVEGCCDLKIGRYTVSMK